MLNKILILALSSIAVSVYADETVSSGSTPGYVQAEHSKAESQGDNQKTSFDANKTAGSAQVNSPTVSSIAYSGAQFPQQNQLTGKAGQKYNSSHPKSKHSKNKTKSFDNNNTDNSNQENSPTVNSMLYSGAQFPQQNAITTSKAKNSNSAGSSSKPVNNPTVNSRLSSANMFPQQNSFNNDGKSSSNKPTSSSGM
jgi:hypothetical protein